jgi:hypothetical protein
VGTGRDLSVPCLLADDPGIRLRRVGTGKRMTFGEGEKTLNEWLRRNAFVAWVVHAMITHRVCALVCVVAFSVTALGQHREIHLSGGGQKVVDPTTGSTPVGKEIGDGQEEASRSATAPETL